MENKEIIPLHEKLFEAVNKVLKDNKVDLASKIEMAVKKSIEQVVSKIDKQYNKAIEVNGVNDKVEDKQEVAAQPIFHNTWISEAGFKEDVLICYELMD